MAQILINLARLFTGLTGKTFLEVKPTIMLKILPILFLVFCCAPKKVNDESAFSSKDSIVTQDFEMAFPRILSDEKWTLDYASDDGGILEARFLKRVGDTTYNTSMTKIYFTDSISYELLWYQKIYSRDGFSYNVNLSQLGDTLYVYKEAMIPNSVKIFVTGKYEYLYSKNLLDSAEKVFYISHRDSLMRVKGDDLPSLPN